MATRTSSSRHSDPEIRAHKDWLSLLQPVGLVVSPPALKKAQATPNANVVAEQQRLIRLVLPPPEAGQGEHLSTETAEHACIAHFPTFAVDILGWRESDLVERPADLAIPVLDHDDVLQPTWGVKGDDGSWMLLVREEAPFGKNLDVVHEVQGQEWEATPQARFERLLRETKVHVGILTNGTQLRLVYAPAGESSGHVTFPVAAMCRSNRESRDIFAALLMLLGAPRLWMKPEKELLPFILKESRKYQAEVTTKLADQVLDGLRELVNGFQSAHVASGGLLLQEMQRSKAGRQEIYGGLLASILRSVFVLYAEDRGLMPQHDTYRRGYSLTHLFEKLREDAALYPDTMDQRYGAWTQLLALYRLIFDGADHGPLSMPAREGKLFNPDTYPFLEGRPWRSHRVKGDQEKPPRVSDGVVYRVLERLLILDGERLSYRALDVEQIGSVYEALMGFDLEVAQGASIAVKPKHVVVDLDAVLRAKGADRDELLKKAEAKAIPKEVKTAKTVEELVTALAKVVSPRTPGTIALGAMYLQPGEERRRSGSHYTPRALTEPIVATTLRPIFEQMGPRPKPKDILALKVCDPAMGSGAFLVEACRQLADKLVIAWNQHPRDKPNFRGEEMVLRARREVAQRCLYGVDKNPFAVDLAKLSLWLATLAQDHPFTFLDHSLKCGDSLVGLTKDQIVDMSWPGMKQLSVAREFIEKRMKDALEDREGIVALGDSDDVRQKQRHLRDADSALEDVRLIGDIIIAAGFVGENENVRERGLANSRIAVLQWLDGTGERGAATQLLTGLAGDPTGGRLRVDVQTFHWEIEFPEVFSGAPSGFDVVVGNPPFMGGGRISTHFGRQYFAYLTKSYAPAQHHCDLVAYFFRRAFILLRHGGCLGLVATNTISQGDTREGGLAEICEHGGTIFAARRRLPWPGAAAIVVSVVHVARGAAVAVQLDDKPVEAVSAYLFPGTNSRSPARLSVNHELFSMGMYPYGSGFMFDDDDREASSLMEMERICASDPRYRERIRAYIGGEEVLNHPQQQHRRWVICLSDLEEGELDEWPELAKIVREKVRPFRAQLGDNPNNVPLRRRWWAFQTTRPRLATAAAKLTRLLVHPNVSVHFAFAFVPSSTIVASPHNVFLNDTSAFFSVMQSRVHEAWARYFASSMKDDLRYTPSDCFETFALPTAFDRTAQLTVAGDRYLNVRATLMGDRREGLTKTYNRFHDPDEHAPEILQLRTMHDEMDRAVLDAYGWTDIRPTCTFLLDYEEAEDEDDTGGTRRKKKPWRYRWPDDVRDEVLARLMKLNAERYAEEQRIGADKQLVAGAVAAEKATKKKTTKKKPAASADAPDLFGLPTGEASDD